MAALLITIQCI